MKTKSKLSAYIFRSSSAALLFSCVIVALCLAINLPQQPAKAFPRQEYAGFATKAHQRAASMPAPAIRILTFADRVAYQRAIEDVYWRHRIWPKERPDPKPALDAVMSQAQIEKKVTEYLRNSQALEDHWQTPITAEQLQAEMERMASHTRQPEVLREIFEALENDPFVIAECLARPILTERLIADLSAQDESGRLDSLRTAETQMPNKVATIDSIAKPVQVNRPYHIPVIIGPSVGCTDDTWTVSSITNAPAARNSHTAIWTGSEMIIWGGYGIGGPFTTGGRYSPSTDSWTATSTTNAPAARARHTAVWTGNEMIVWGGCVNGSCNQALFSGGRYDPLNDTWTATSITNAPSGRRFHTAVWTNNEMIVWGGVGDAWFNTGGRYDPVTDTWTATSTTDAPAARFGHTAVWTGSEMIVWGGNGWNTGGRYDPVTDSWTATSTANAPSGRSNHTAIWTGSEMIVWGGDNGIRLRTGGRYNRSTDTWTATNIVNAPEGRSNHTAIWTGIGGEMIVWGGENNSPAVVNTGGRYDPETENWTATSTTDTPSERYVHTAVWTHSEMIVWGGSVGGSYLNTGGRYCVNQTGSYPRGRRRFPRPHPTPIPRP